MCFLYVCPCVGCTHILPGTLATQHQHQLLEAMSEEEWEETLSDLSESDAGSWCLRQTYI